MDKIIEFYWTRSKNEVGILNTVLDDLNELLVNVDRWNSHNISCILYWSLATYDQTKNSDIDVMFMKNGKSSKELFDQLKWWLIDISKKNKLEVDEEVPFKSKLIFSHNEILESLLAKWFPNIDWKIEVPNIISTKDLRKKSTKIRLWTNIITTPNIWIFHSVSEKEFYDQIKYRWWLLLQSLARNLFTQNFKNQKITQNDLLEVLATSNWNEWRKHLWYKIERPFVRKYLVNLLEKKYSNQELDSMENSLWSQIFL